MSFVSNHSDLASSLRIAQSVSKARVAFEKAGLELSTGVKSDADLARTGAYNSVFAIDNLLLRNATYASAITSASAKLTAQTATLEKLSANTTDIAGDVLAFLDMGGPNYPTTDAKSAFDNLVRELNGHVTGEALFSGTATDQLAIPDGETLYSDLMALIDGSADAASAIAAVDSYMFAAGGAFETGVYGGSTNAISGISISETTKVSIDTRADDPALRRALKNFAIIGAVEQGSFAANASEKKALLEAAATDALSNTSAVIELATNIGYQLERLAVQETRNSTHRYETTIFRNQITSVDQYEAASRVTQLETQLTSIFTVVSRAQNLTLTNFLR
jgi:flagellar hook-associated protein 3 FlgL